MGLVAAVGQRKEERSKLFSFCLFSEIESNKWETRLGHCIRNAAIPTTDGKPHSFFASTGGVSALSRDLFHFETTSQATGFFVCVNSFLSLLTVMPIRVLLVFWRAFKNRQFRRPSPSELSDLACFLVLASGTILLGRTDISLIYHMIRGQSTIKLYVVYNILEIFDKLCQSFCGDVFEALFSSADKLASSPPKKLRFCAWRFGYKADEEEEEEAMGIKQTLPYLILLASPILLVFIVAAHRGNMH